jgi:hypothetical protein
MLPSVPVIALGLGVFFILIGLYIIATYEKPIKDDPHTAVPPPDANVIMQDQKDGSLAFGWGNVVVGVLLCAAGAYNYEPANKQALY